MEYYQESRMDPLCELANMRHFTVPRASGQVFPINGVSLAVRQLPSYSSRKLLM
jgi:hypothetical protein